MSFVNPNVYPALVISIILFFTCRYLTDKFRFKLIAGCLFAILASMSLVILLPYLSTRFGENPAYANFRAQPYTELVICLVAPFAGWLSTIRHADKRSVLWFCLVCMLGYVSLPFIKPVIRPPEQITEKWKNDIAMQTTPSTCGPASLTTILTRYGDTVSERKIAEGAYTSGSGTENWYLARYAASKGHGFQFLHEPDLSQVPRPSIIGVKIGHYGHFVTLLDRNMQAYLIGDSLSGPHWLTPEQFAEKYRYTGFVLHISKSSDD